MRAFLGDPVLNPSSVGRDEERAPLKTPAWEARIECDTFGFEPCWRIFANWSQSKVENTVGRSIVV